MYLFWDYTCLWFEFIDFEAFVTSWKLLDVRFSFASVTITDGGMRLSYLVLDRDD